MRLIRVALIGLLVTGAASVAAGQEQRQQASTVNVNRLPIDLHRIQRDLRQASSAQTENHGLKIAYRVDVYGQAPRIELFTKDDNLSSAAVPYGAPTHAEMTAAAMRTADRSGDPTYHGPQVPDFTSFFRWLAEKTGRK